MTGRDFEIFSEELLKANGFTSAAIELAQKNNVLLWDREKMKTMLLNIKDLEK